MAAELTTARDRGLRPGSGPDDRERSGMPGINYVIVNIEKVTLTLSDGEERTVVLLPDGSWSCPWCSAPCIPGEDHYENRGWEYPCPSPACMAGGRGDPESVAAVKLEHQRQAEAAESRSWLARAQEEQRAKREQSRAAAVREFAAEAAESGACVPCWSKSTSHGMFLGDPRVIRHRRPGNCPLARRSR